ncbi:hypothetical protein J5N97_017574 [Dioscorea zingiberensis]|uniref:RNA polymerase sigma-70 domain-containing protein n=1 Tax=Dioscorea zingiberensis TaxID=325984 RepID=A0A9D5CMP1_9LILI|nr:hypothetical protein J5N97_017574 [Dioscorea zingiberensis]
MAEAVALANAAAQAAKDTVSSAMALSEIKSMQTKVEREYLQEHGFGSTEKAKEEEDERRTKGRSDEKEGCIGLLQGAQRFDAKRGNKLSTYVYWWIKQAIIRAIAKKSRLVRLPGSMCAVARKVADATSLLQRQLGRWPTYHEIADYTDLSASSVKIVTARSRHPISMNRPVKNKEITLEDVIPGPDETRPEFIVAKQLMLQDMEKLLKTLNSREEYIIRMHYGLTGERVHSCDEIGRLLNLSRERIRQIHHSALTRLREERDLIESLRQNLT